MKKTLPAKFILLWLMITGAKILSAQVTVQIGSGTDIPANTLYSPVYRFTATSATTGSRANILFTQAEMATAGIPSGAIITKVAFNKTNAANFVTPATYTMLMANTSNTSLATSLTWASIQSTHASVFTSTSFNIPLAAGWVEWNITPFTYTGGAFEIANECAMVGDGGATDAFKWEYTNSINATMIVGVASSTGTTLNGTVAAYKHRPNIRITYMLPTNCTSPPTAGAATASVSTPVCPGTAVNLDLTGHSTGVGQTYVWKSSSTQNGTYTDISSSLTTPSFSINPAATAWYKAALTCGASTELSAPVQVVINGGLPAGTYTINSAQSTGSGNYQTFANAIGALSCGITGPIIFNVAPGSGPYNEQVIIPQIGGVSSVNTITFNGNGAIVSDNSAAVTGERAVFKLNGADYVTLDNFVINTGAGTYGYGIQLLNDADNNTISNCTINNNMSSTSTTNYAGILVNSTASAITTAGASLCDNNVITGNTINGGYAGVAIVANSTTSQVFNNKITKNIINDFQEYGIYINGNVGTLIDSNDISRPTRSTLTTFRGIGVVNVSQKTNITRNRLHDPFVGNMSSTAAAFCIYFSSCRTTVGNEDTVANNLIYNVNGATGNHNGLLVTASDNIKFYHNTISLEDVSASCTTCGTRGFYMQTAPFAGLDFRNNIVTISRGGTGPKQIIYFEGTGVTFTSNNNDYYMASSGGTTNDIGFVNGTAYPSWAAWHGSGQDNASQSIDPVYINPGAGNLVPLASSIDNIGVPVGVLKDINGITRSQSSPDPGAYEFNNLSAGLNMGAEALVTPALAASGCYTNSETVTIRVRNSSSAAINFATNPVTVTTNITGAVTQTLSAILNTGALAGGAFMDVPMSTTLNMSVIGGYSFNANTTLAGDVNTANDAMPVPAIRNKVQLETGTASASPDSYCMTGGAPVLSVTGTNGHSSIQWQQSMTSGTGFGDISGATMSPYTVSSPIGQTMYYKLVAKCGTSSFASSEVTVALNSPQITSVTNGTRCGVGPVNLQASGSAGTVINWYTTPGAVTPLATGNSYNPVISANTTFYAAATIQSTGIAGPNDPASVGDGGGTSVPIATYYVTFDVLRDLTLLSVDVFPTSASPGASASITIQNSAGTTIQTVPYTVTATGGNRQTVPLNITLPAGTGYKMGQGTNVSLIRNTTGAVYPYISSALNITSNNFNPVYYYYFYNWQYSFQCESSSVPVLGRIDDCPMPVTLLNFTGEKQNNINKLRWTTTTEVNNAGFELERSADGKNFSKLAFVVSLAENGNSNRTLDYVYYDERPLAGNGYYRLKQVDKDGKTSYSNIVLLRGDKVKEVMITSIYPNPAEKEVNLVITSPNVEKVSLIITDVTGKVVAQSALQLIAGDNLQKLSVSQLAPGTYFIKTVCANGCESAVQKFVRH